MISLIFGVPVMVVMIYFHWIIHTPMHPEKQVHIFVPALSLDNIILFLLATPVQVRIFRSPRESVRRPVALAQRPSTLEAFARRLGASIGYLKTFVQRPFDVRERLLDAQ